MLKNLLLFYFYNLKKHYLPFITIILSAALYSIAHADSLAPTGENIHKVLQIWDENTSTLTIEQFNTSKELLEAEIKAQPNDGLPLSLMGILYTKYSTDSDRTIKAEDYLNKALKIPSTNRVTEAMTLASFAELYENHKQDYQKAADYYDQAFAKSPKIAPIYYWQYAKLLKGKLGDNKKALKIYKQAIDTWDNEPNLELNLIYSLYAELLLSEDVDTGIKLMEHMIERKMYHAHLIQSYAIELWVTDRTKEAQRWFEIAIQHDLTSVSATNFATYLASDRYETVTPENKQKAYHYYRLALEKLKSDTRPNNEKYFTLTNYAYFLEKNPDINEDIDSIYQQAITMAQPESQYVEFTYAEYLAKNPKNCSKAKDFYDKALPRIQKKPNNWTELLEQLKKACPNIE